MMLILAHLLFGDSISPNYLSFRLVLPSSLAACTTSPKKSLTPLLTAHRLELLSHVATRTTSCLYCSSRAASVYIDQRFWSLLNFYFPFLDLSSHGGTIYRHHTAYRTKGGLI